MTNLQTHNAEQSSANLSLQKGILNHKWKKCIFMQLDFCDKGCPNCKGSGFEPMEIENLTIGFDRNYKNGLELKYKEGEIIEICIAYFKGKDGLGTCDIECQWNLPNCERRKQFKIIKTNSKTGWGVIPIGGK